MKRTSKTRYQIASQAGLSQIMISRFVTGQRDIRLATADRLAQVQGLRMVGVGKGGV